MTSWTLWASFGPSPHWPTAMDTSTRFRSSQQSESDKASSHLRMAAAERCNPMDYSIWSILEARASAKPHKNLEGSEAVVAALVRPIAGGRIAAHGLEFSEVFDAVY